MGSQYCSPNDLTLTGINPIALVDVSSAEQLAACQQASEEMDSIAFRPRYGNASPILLAWGNDVTRKAVQIAVYYVMRQRGYNPSAGADDNIKADYEEAIKWCQGVGKQAISPDVTPNIPQGQNSGPDLPQVNSAQQRGWLTTSSSGKPTVGW